MINNTKKMVTMAVLAGLSMVMVTWVHFPIIPSAPFLEYDPADVPLLMGAFLFGPLAGLLMTVVVSLIQALTVSAASGWVGFVMHVIATGTLVLVAGAIYKYKHSFTGALIALICGSLAMTVVMIPSNLFFTVRYWGMPLATVKALLPAAIIPFNLIKSVANSMITLVLYKRISNLLRG